MNLTANLRPDFPEFLDSTILAAFRSCPRRCFLQYFLHWKPRTTSVHLHAGGAFAYGIEQARRCFFEGIPASPDGTSHELPAGDADLATAYGMRACAQFYGDFDCPPDSAKSLERTVGALEFYFEQYPMGRDGLTPANIQGRLGIEFSFAEPLPDTEHPVTGAPILYTGRADLIGVFADDVYVVDEKTASQLGMTWSQQWDLRSQFTGYIWAGRLTGLHVAGAIVRGVSILKTKYDTQQAITYRGDWEIARWLEQTARDVRRMGQCWQDCWWDFSLDHACTEYGGCVFRNICKSPNPEEWLPQYFEQRIWDPVKREERPVDSAPWEPDGGSRPGGDNYTLGELEGDGGIGELLRDVGSSAGRG